MYAPKPGRPRKPLNEEKLHELALFYLGKFATTRAKLANYLNRKVRERGWEGNRSPDIERLVERLASSDLVDDALYALSKSRSLTERGYGAARVRRFVLPVSTKKTEHRRTSLRRKRRPLPCFVLRVGSA
jgi:regulatory protein